MPSPCSLGLPVSKLVKTVFGRRQFDTRAQPLLENNFHVSIRVLYLVCSALLLSVHVTPSILRCHLRVAASNPNDTMLDSVKVHVPFDTIKKQVISETFFPASHHHHHHMVVLKWPKQQSHHEDHYSQCKYEQYQSVL